MLLWYQAFCLPCLSFLALPCHLSLDCAVYLLLPQRLLSSSRRDVDAQSAHATRADTREQVYRWEGWHSQYCILLILHVLVIVCRCYRKNNFAAPSNVAGSGGVWPFSENTGMFGQLSPLPSSALSKQQKIWAAENTLITKACFCYIMSGFSSVPGFSLDFSSPPTAWWAPGKCSHCLLLIFLAYMMMVGFWTVPEQSHLCWMGHEIGWNLWGIFLQIILPSAMFCQRHSIIVCKYMLFHVTVIWK